MSETQISAKIKMAIKKAFPQLQFTRLQCGMAKGLHGGLIRLSDVGWPDYIGYLPDGRFLGIEIKDPEGHTQKTRAMLQGERAKSINDSGGVAITVTNPTEAVEAIRREMQKCAKGITSS